MLEVYYICVTETKPEFCDFDRRLSAGILIRIHKMLLEKEPEQSKRTLDA